jgi:hypothetical protein
MPMLALVDWFAPMRALLCQPGYQSVTCWVAVVTAVAAGWPLGHYLRRARAFRFWRMVRTSSRRAGVVNATEPADG